MEPSSPARSRLAVCLLPLAVSLTACAAGKASPPSAAAGDPQVGGPYHGERKVELDVSYDLPPGTTVQWEPHYEAGNCIKDQRSWTDTVASDGKGGGGLKPALTVLGDVSESCGWEKSYGSWNLIIRDPASGYQPVANVKLITIDTFFGGRIESQCHFMKDIACSGAEASAGEDHVMRPTLKLGPMDIPTPPSLSCTGGIRVPRGQPVQDLHVCTVEGYPRPRLQFAGITSKVTLRRWPTERDTWIVVNGTFDDPTTIQISADVPGTAWATYRTVNVELE